MCVKCTSRRLVERAPAAHLQARRDGSVGGVLLLEIRGAAGRRRVCMNTFACRFGRRARLASRLSGFCLPCIVRRTTCA